MVTHRPPYRARPPPLYKGPMRKHSPQSRKYPSLNNKQITKETVINEQKDVYVDNKFITLMEEQDIIEGYWDENKITENILNSPELKDVCNKIRSLRKEY